LRLINFDGLNCFSNSVVTIADSYGVDYLASFCDLWAETDFRYAPYSRRLVSQRMTDNLSVLGARFEQGALADDSENVKVLDFLKKGDCVVVGMDAFFTPWSPSYKTFSGSHYFIAMKAKGDELSCFDPTHGAFNARMTMAYIAEHATDLILIRSVAKGALPFDEREFWPSLYQELPRIFKGIHERLNGCIGEKYSAYDELAKQIGAMVENRQLTARYLAARSVESNRELALFEPEYFDRWERVRLALYKAGRMRDNSSIVAEVHECLSGLSQDEIQAVGRLTTS